MRTIYLCNGKSPECSKTGCKYLGNGDCNHTLNEKYAKNPPDRRKFITTEHLDLWEVENDENG